MTTPLQDNETSGISIRIITGGQALSAEVIGQLSSLRVRHELYKIPRAELVLSDGDPSTGQWSIASGDWFGVGAGIEIHLGYGGDVTPVFSGMVTGLEVSSRRGRPSQLKVKLSDKAILLTGSRKTREWLEINDADIASQMASEAGLEIATDDDGIEHLALPQLNLRDWDLLLRRARALGFVLSSRLGELGFHRPTFDGEVAYELSLGSNLIESELRLDVSEAVAGMTIRSWDPENQERLESEADHDSSEGPRPGNHRLSELLEGFSGRDRSTASHGGALTSEELDAWLEGQSIAARLSLVVGRVRTVGLPGAAPDSRVSISGMGGAFNGEHYVSAVEHCVDRRGWTTDLYLGLDRKNAFGSGSHPEPDVEVLPGACGLVSQDSRLHLAEVLALESPPQPGMIRVRLEIQEAGAEGLWARLMSPDAGENRGFFFLPEVGDEVVVQFLNGDPRHPIVLGALWSASHQLPGEADDDNNIRKIVSRRGVTLGFRDEQGKESLTLSTPGGQELLFDDERRRIELRDTHGNVITFSEEGISIESAGALTLKSSGDTSLEAQNRLGLSGNSSLSAETSGVLRLRGQTINLN